jgi:chemotaxis protein CheX
MTEASSNFVQFSKPFLDALKETFELMVQTELKPHSPKIKESNVAKGDITAIIGMNGDLEKDGETKEFKGLLAISWKEDVYIKFASRMLMDDYKEYCEEISDSGAEVVNIVMGNAKSGLAPLGFKIGMATPTTIRGTNHEIKYPPKTTVIEITIDSDLGPFSLELCYQES